MVTVESYPVAVALCIVTMLCWGSWANTQKLASKEWRFQLFYWDYSIGVLLLALALAFTLGSTGDAGRSFLPDLAQADAKWLGSAFLGATMIGAIWGVFIWKEFKGAPPGTSKLLGAMFLFYLIGLSILIASKLR